MRKFYQLFSKKRHLVILMMMFATSLWAQNRTVTGTVTSADDGSGVPGVNIVEKGTNNGSVTNVDGTYAINVGNGATLVFSFVGYTSQEIAVGNQSVVNVNLKPDVTSLQEVVVIGYGQVEAKDVTGTLVSLKAKDFNPGLVVSPEQLMHVALPVFRSHQTVVNPERSTPSAYAVQVQCLVATNHYT